jgi:hypothetical protein
MEPAAASGRPLHMRLFVTGLLLMLTAACSVHQSEPAVTATTDSSNAQAQPIVTAPPPATLLGDWKLVDTKGDTELRELTVGLELRRRGGKYWAFWDDGINDHGVQWSLAAEGSYRVLRSNATLVGCAHKGVDGVLREDDGCGKPGGLGIETATSVGTDGQGRLLNLNDDGEALAVYQRA